MADNRVEYGFRWSTAANGRPCPEPIEGFVASGVSFDVSGGQANLSIGAGDLVSRASTGGFILCLGDESTAVPPFGVVVAVTNYFDTAKGVRTPTALLPSDVAWGTLLERQSRIMVVPIRWGLWEVDCDENTTATTEAAYQAFIGENVDHVNSITNTTRPSPRINISTHATTNSLHFRIAGISATKSNQDFSGANVKLIVETNIAQDPISSATGV